MSQTGTVNASGFAVTSMWFEESLRPRNQAARGGWFRADQVSSAIAQMSLEPIVKA